MDIFVVIVVKTLGDGRYGVYIPDLDLMQYGSDRVVAMGEALQILRAVRHYKIYNGLELEPKVTAEEAQKYCKNPADFITMASVSAQ